MDRTNENKLQNKKSFILYLDQSEIFEQLTDEEAGKLIKGIFYYVHSGEKPELNKLLSIAFLTIKQSLHRDLEKWRSILDRNKINGSKGGRPKNPKNPLGYLETQRNPKNPDSVNVSVSVNDSVSDNIKEIINYLNVVCGTNFKSSTKNTRQLINARIKEGFVLEDFKKVIDKKYSEWAYDEKFCKFLRPETLFSNKFDGYLNQINKKEKEVHFD